MSTAKTTTKSQASDDVGTGLKSPEKKLLYSVLTHLQGSINFEKVATDIEVPNAEAARKRFKRLLEKELIITNVKGDRIGGDEDKGGSGGIAKAPAKTPTKVKTPATTKESEAPNAAGKKRKIAEMEKEQVEVKAED